MHTEKLWTGQVYKMVAKKCSLRKAYEKFSRYVNIHTSVSINIPEKNIIHIQP